MVVNYPACLLVLTLHFLLVGAVELLVDGLVCSIDSTQGGRRDHKEGNANTCPSIRLKVICQPIVRVHI